MALVVVIAKPAIGQPSKDQISYDGELFTKTGWRRRTYGAFIVRQESNSSQLALIHGNAQQ
jgi:hypothetical protein